MKTKTFLSLLLVAGLVSAPAIAHPRLLAAGPIPGSVVKKSPETIRIQFSEGIELKFSGIVLKDAKGEVQDLSPPAVSADKKIMTVLVVPVLPPGKYTVEWHALGDDTHPQKGNYKFEIKP